MEQNVLVTKMIGIVVAVIVAAVVLVPICNSLTEGEGGSGGGGEGGSGESYIGNDLRNMADHYGIEGFPFEAYSEYGNDTFDKRSVTDLNLEITLNDVTTWLEQIRLSEDSELNNLNFSILNMGITNRSTPVSVNYSYSDGVGMMQVQLNNTTHMTIRTNGDNSDNVQDFTISVVNGNATITWADGEETYSGSVKYADCFEKSSTQTHITYSFGTTESDDYKPNGEFEIYAGCNLTFVLIVGEDVDHSFVNYEVSEYVYDGTYYTISGSTVGDVGEYTFTIKFPATPTDISNVYLTSNESAEVNVQNASNESIPNSSIYLPVVSINAIEGGGDDSEGDGSSDLGVAGTIIGIIPVFVILAILMGAAGLFYQNRKTI